MILKDASESQALLDISSDDGRCETPAEYLQRLSQLDKSHIGVVSFCSPGVPYRIYFRCGTSDLASFVQIFARDEYGFPICFQPRRILDLGAYVGYASVYFAMRFPTALITAVEPATDNFRILSLNTLAYPNIKTINAGVWGSRSRLLVRQEGAHDWGTRLKLGEDEQNSVEAFTVAEILDQSGWSDFDYLKCDIEASELSVFAQSGDYIASMVNCCAIETHDAIAPGASKLIACCFDSARFLHTRSGEFDVFLRRDVKDAHPPQLELLKPSQGVRGIRLMNVPEEPWGFYIFGGNSCQLHPGLDPIRAPEVSTEVTLQGQSFFECKLGVENPLGFAVKFVFQVRPLDDDETVVFEASQIVHADEQCDWLQPLPHLSGDYRVALQTTIAEHGRTNHQACANWISPKFR